MLWKLNLLLIFVTVSVNFVHAQDIRDNCLETIQLNPAEGMSGEDTANFVNCIIPELQKRGINTSGEYYQKLSNVEREKYDEMFVKTFGEIIEGERTRRKEEKKQIIRYTNYYLVTD